MAGNKHPTEKLGRKPKTSSSKSIQALRNWPSILIKHFKELNRNTKLALVLVFILLLVGITSFGILNQGNKNDIFNDDDQVNQTDSTNQTTARISLREGTLQTKDEDGEWVDVLDDITLSEEDELRTVGATSRSVVAFENGSELRMDANTEIRFDAIASGRTVISQKSGYVFNRVKTNDNYSYTISTTDAQYEAKGTAFISIANGDEQAIEVYENSVIETTTNQSTLQGEKLIVDSLISPRDNGQTQKLDIEIVKKNAFVIWNRTLDMENEEFKNNLGFLQDIDAPTVTINDPADNATILLEPNAEVGSVEFSGSTEKSARLTVLSKSDANAQPTIITVGADGNFKSPVITAPLGSSVFEFTVKDRSGNMNVINIRLNFQRKSAPITAAGIVLNVALNDSKIQADWSYTGSTKAPDGVKIVYSKDKKPTLEKADSVYAKSGTTTSITAGDLDADSTYYFRACIYNKDKNTCSTYSEEVSLKTPE